MKKVKIRLDDLVMRKGFAETKSIAQALIISGKIYIDEKKLDKPGHSISSDSEIIFRGPLHPWVSRGGIKLDHALKTFKLNVSDLIALDIGSSTGGFSDVLLQKGVKKLYAVDVGYGQLHEKILNNPRVFSMERKNDFIFFVIEFLKEIRYRLKVFILEIRYRLKVLILTLIFFIK